MKPKVSILICTYNAEKFITETIDSILNQTYRDFELLILDNGSKDGTRDIITNFQLSISNKKAGLYPKPYSLTPIFLSTNIGAYAGLNFLLDKAKGMYIAINDHDDIWHKDKLQKQIDFLERQKEYVGCGTAIINWYEKYNTYFYRRPPTRWTGAWHTSLVFRNDGYRYDVTQKVATDFYFIKNILCGEKRKIYNFQEPYVLRRIFKHTNNLSGTWMKEVSFLEIIKMHIGLFDKLALLNRRIIPQDWVEWVVVKVFGNNIPEKYRGYFVKR